MVNLLKKENTNNEKIKVDEEDFELEFEEV